jgi:hypothetical protein
MERISGLAPRPEITHALPDPAGQSFSQIQLNLLKSRQA